MTGATGTIGRALLPLLQNDTTLTIRAATRHPHRQESTERLEWVRFDWDAPDDIDEIVMGVNRLFILPPPATHPLPMITRVLERAAAEGVGHVVLLSTLGADFEPGFAFGRWAREGEHAVAASGLPYTVLRPNSYMTNFLTTQRPDPDGALRLPWKDGATSFIDPADAAAVAACVLRRPDGHAGATYELTGPEALDLGAVAAALSAATGAPIHYRNVTLADAATRLTDRGVPDAMVTAFGELHQVMASGARRRTTDTVLRMTGQPPRTFAAFAARHADAWRELVPSETASIS
ncbi:MAG: NAD(P)H-binding protein [Actinobacteria bacterium]|nr:NAD(P)H-binding protein [Actinomycetota bacterium]